MRYFSKTTNFHVSLGPFHCSELKKDPELWHGDIFRPKKAYLPWRMSLFDKKQNFDLLFTPFCKIFGKNLWGPKFWPCIIFGPRMAYLPQTRIFLEKSLIQFPCTSWPLLQKNFRMNLELWCYVILDPKCHLGPKMAHLSRTRISQNPQSRSRLLIQGFVQKICKIICEFIVTIMHHIWTQNCSFSWNNNFCGTNTKFAIK